MRKMIFWCGALCLLLTGCGSATTLSDAPTTTTTTTATTTAQPTTTTTAPAIPDGLMGIEEALQIAYDYWHFTPGDSITVGKGEADDPAGAGDVSIATYPTADAPYYEMVYSWMVPQPDGSTHRSVLDRVWIDAGTGTAYATLPS